MIDEKCKNCPELVIPYFGINRTTPNRELPEELKMGTCKCNMDLLDRKDEGYCGYCHPNECNGAGHTYYFDYNNDIKFIN